MALRITVLQRAIAKPHLYHQSSRNSSCRASHSSQEGFRHLLKHTQWLLPDPSVEITTVQHGGASFTVVRDDLLHPYLGGNKLRKLDGLWAQLAGATDVVTCGGLQSAHTVAVAAACAQHGKRCHLLVRGERPAVPTGHHLYARLFAHHIQYVSRAEYADRDGMLAAYVQQLQLQLQQSQAQQQGGQSGLGSATGSRTAADSSHEAATAAAAVAVSGGSSLDTRAPSSGSSSSQRVVVIPEGAAEPGALLGLVRLVGWLAAHPMLAGRRCNIVVDSGTGATATGLALGAALLGLPWAVTGVMLAAQPPYYQQQQQALTLAFCEAHGWPNAEAVQQGTAQRLHWVPRQVPRKFGKVLAGEVAACQSVAQQHGIVLDPIWTLAAWELCCKLAGSTPAETAVGSHAGSSSSGSTSTVTLQHQQQQRQQCAGEEAIQQQQEVVVMLHTGGMLGLCGLAQRLPDQF